MPEPLQPAPPRQIIRNAAWLVADDEAAQSHVDRRDVDLTIEGDTIAAIGPAGPADSADAVEIDGRGFAVLPGFVDIHAHPSSEPMLKGLTDEVGSRQALQGWMRTERARLSRRADAAKAIDYMLKRWPAFTRFLDDGRICLTNNAAERALRGIALGRRAWLFAGSDWGGERAGVANRR
jgi:hypothetical protein